MALERRLRRLRALVDRLERLPASARREWMLREARARMVDVETGVEPRPMRALEDESPAPPAPAQAGDGRAAAPPRHRTQSRPSVPQAPRSVSHPAPPRVAGPEPSRSTLGAGELLWLGDPLGDTFSEPGDGSTGTGLWKRGLRG